MGKNNKKNGAAAVRTKKVDPLILGTLVFAVVVLAALITLCVYRNSDAYSTSTGIRVNSSKMYSPTVPACHDVPQPIMIMRWALTIFGIISEIPPR